MRFFSGNPSEGDVTTTRAVLKVENSWHHCELNPGPPRPKSDVLPLHYVE